MLQVGDAVKVGESNSTSKSIDTKNADYDVITFAAAVTGATEGVDVLSDDNLLMQLSKPTWSIPPITDSRPYRPDMQVSSSRM